MRWAGRVGVAEWAVEAGVAGGVEGVGGGGRGGGGGGGGRGSVMEMGAGAAELEAHERLC